MDWKVAVGVGGPGALAVWGFYHLVSEYMKSSTIFKDNLWLNLLLLSYIFLFFVVMAWLWLKKPNASAAGKKQIFGNQIENNEVLGDLGVKSGSVVDNKISGNKVGGSLNIGE